MVLVLIKNQSYNSVSLKPNVFMFSKMYLSVKLSDTNRIWYDIVFTYHSGAVELSCDLYHCGNFIRTVNRQLLSSQV